MDNRQLKRAGNPESTVHFAGRLTGPVMSLSGPSLFQQLGWSESLPAAWLAFTLPRRLVSLRVSLVDRARLVSGLRVTLNSLTAFSGEGGA